MSTQDRVIEICTGFLDGKPPLPEENLVDRGVDSLVAAEIVARLEIEWDVDLVERFFTTPTVAALAKEIDEQVATR